MARFKHLGRWVVNSSYPKEQKDMQETAAKKEKRKVKKEEKLVQSLEPIYLDNKLADPLRETFLALVEMKQKKKEVELYRKAQQQAKKIEEHQLEKYGPLFEKLGKE